MILLKQELKMMDKYYLKLPTKVGTFVLVEDNTEHISGLYLEPYDTKGLINQETPLLSQLKQELLAYFKGTLKEFTVPIKQEATPFQQAVYEILMDVPYGYTLTYGDIAYLMGNKAYQAVGGALNKNKIMIIIPCHRVLSESGLGGFYYGQELKKYLLDLEKSNL